VKLLLDHNLSPDLIWRLKDLFPASSHAYLLGLDRSPDQEVWEYARKEDFVIVTKDADFVDLSLLFGFPPKVVWIRRGNCRTKDIENIIRNHYSEVLALGEDETMGVLTLF
jgi:predicted nuclease of predicted toxin-antitoxin system